MGKRGILRAIRHLGCVQFDPLDVVGPNPDLVLQARVADYRPAMLAACLERFLGYLGAEWLSVESDVVYGPGLEWLWDTFS